ncbi:hypothetical protein [Actinocorallia sp. A-T 12471]|uniref:hypothetical protein n=1 Tax=Actinocorallia sp. A-T 12471 TaxID=3089813 RepID=UPI0029D210C1|nr:hypothetical protein [Actinocorallia sp. A-T 12471]MDX6740448.1 hypothetical protein [Actinocorallia sp. A-T 12471]
MCNESSPATPRSATDGGAAQQAAAQGPAAVMCSGSVTAESLLLFNGVAGTLLAAYLATQSVAVTVAAGVIGAVAAASIAVISRRR